MKYLVISYDDDEQQTFWDHVIADTEQLAEARISKLRDYATVCDVLTEDSLRQMAADLFAATPESVADAQNAILDELSKFECTQCGELDYLESDSLNQLCGPCAVKCEKEAAAE